MKIQRLEITNYKVIQNLKFDCGTRMNVFVGTNGSGKSTVLQAIKTQMSWFNSRMRSKNGRGTILYDSDITLGENLCMLNFIIDSEDSEYIHGRLYKQKTTNRVHTMDGKSNMKEIAELTDNIVNEYDKNKMSCRLPVVAHYGVNRTVTDAPARLHKNHALEPIMVYDKALEGNVNFRSFFEWYREREDLENEKYRETGILTKDKQLNAIRIAFKKVLPDYGEFKVKRNPRRFVMQKNGKEFNFNQLSDGERCYLTLIGDMARKLAMANPAMKNPLEGEGIFLIDEIDLHLHPQWQQDILKNITDIFPNSQFFITTHSPFVASAIKSNENDVLIILNNGEASLASENPYGAEVGITLTSPAFNLSSLRNKETQKHIDNIWKCLSDNDYFSDKFKEEEKWLKSNIDSADIEFAKIRLQIEKIKKNKG